MLSHRLFDPVTIRHVSRIPHISSEPPHGENLARITGPQQKKQSGLHQKPKLRAKLQPYKMDPFAQQVQRIENNDKVKEIVEALRLIPIADNDVKTQINASLEKILTPAAHKIPETQKKITEFASLNQIYRTTI